MYAKTKIQNAKNWMKDHSFELVTTGVLSLVAVATIVAVSGRKSDEDANKLYDEDTWIEDQINDGNVILALGNGSLVAVDTIKSVY